MAVMNQDMNQDDLPFPRVCTQDRKEHMRTASQSLPRSPYPRPNTPQRTPSPLIDRPLRHPPLRPNPLDHPLQPRLHHDTPDNHLPQNSMQRLKIENHIQFADILKQTVQSLDEDLDEVEQGQGRFGGGGDDDEVERCVVAVGDEGGEVVLLFGGRDGAGGGGREEGGQREEVAG